MKKLICATTMLALNIMAFAQTSSTSTKCELYLYQKDGTKVEFLLHDRPSVVLDGENLKITTVTNSVDYPLASVHKFCFTNEESSTTSVNNAKVKKLVQYSNDAISICAYKPYCKFAIIGVNGVKVKECETDKNGNATISLYDIPIGTYIVSSTNVNYKFIRK